MQPAIAIAPAHLTQASRGQEEAEKERRRLIAAAIEQSGARVTTPAEAQGLIWLDIGDAKPLAELLDDSPGITWVQLPWAGVEGVASSGLLQRPIRFTCAKASYGEQVGEHALMLALATLRHVAEQARNRTWTQREPESLFRKRVTILGAGGIATTLVSLLAPFDCDVTVLRRTPSPMRGASRTLPIDQLADVLPHTDVLVLALALTPDTRHIIGAHELALLPAHAVLVNVARGAHIDTDALVACLEAGGVAAAGLDVTDPEPLPDDHPLWSLDNALITSHCADSVAFCTRKLVERVAENVARFIADEPLVGSVDATAGY